MPTTDALPPVVFACDDAYRTPLLVALESLCVTNAEIVDALTVLVLHEGLDPATQEAIESRAAAHGLAVELRRAALPDLPYNTAFGGSRANYLRLAIPAALPGATRAVYLDADLVIRGDIRPLLLADLTGFPIGAVRDPVNPTLETGRALPGWSELGLPGEREYFNSGVMVFDLPACAQDGLFERAFSAVEQHSDHLRLWDQDALNLAADDRWSRLPRRWNTAPLSALSRTPWIRYSANHVIPLAELIADEAEATILHYVSPSKPWRGLLPAGDANDMYQSYLASIEGAPE